MSCRPDLTALGTGHGPENKHTSAAFPLLDHPDGGKTGTPLNGQITTGDSGPAESEKTRGSPGNGNWTLKGSSR